VVQRLLARGCDTHHLDSPAVETGADYRTALTAAAVTVMFELLALASTRSCMFDTGFMSSFASVTLGGTTIAATSAGLGAAG